ncbi:MAG: histidine kinase [Bacteroidales bacterium]|nr:histidine kinase [Bacteroidales bacterium]
MKHLINKGRLKERVLVLLLSLFFSAVIYALMRIPVKKYQLGLVSSTPTLQLYDHVSADLDGDNFSEFIRCKKNLSSPGVVIEKPDTKLIRTWNLEGEWIEFACINVVDHDRDGYREILGFTYHSDSIYLNILEPMQAKGIERINIALSRVQLHNDGQDWIVNCIEPVDMTGDGLLDVVITIHSGFSLSPRKMFIYDIAENRIIAQKINPGNNITNAVVTDLNQDGIPEITGSTYAPNNYGKQPVEISDSCSWLLIYDHELNFFASPKSFCQAASGVITLPVPANGKQSLAVFYIQHDQSSHVQELRIYQWKEDSLSLTRKKVLDPAKKYTLLSADKQNKGSFYFKQDLEICRMNQLLEEEIITTLDEKFRHSEWHSIDIDGDRLEEHIFVAARKYLCILQNDYTHPVEIELDAGTKAFSFSMVRKDDEHALKVFTGNQNVLMDYHKNPYYPLRHFLFLAIFLVNLALFSFLARLQRRRIEVKIENEKKLLHYQLANVKQQLDPHFLFNSIINISNFYQDGEKENAYSYLGKISKLIRGTLQNSHKTTIPLKEEINFVNAYLQLEKLRYKEKLDFNIAIDENYHTVPVPKMLIQNFVENALKHGIKNLRNRTGFVSLTSHKIASRLEIWIEDNGIGREAASRLQTFGAGKGLEMIKEILLLYKRLDGIEINYRIVDLYDEEEKPVGTKIILSIPVKNEEVKSHSD